MLSLFFLQPMPFLWVIGVFDAWKVGQDNIKKEPLVERLKSANNRRSAYAWVRDVFPQIKRTLFHVLFLVILIITTGRFYLPWTVYREYLLKALIWSSKQGMMLIPELIRGIIAVLPAK